MKLPVYWTSNSITKNRIKPEYILKSRTVEDFPMNSMVVHLSEVTSDSPRISIHVLGGDERGQHYATKMIAHVDKTYLCFSGALTVDRKDSLNQLIEVIDLAKTVAYSTQYTLENNRELEKVLTW